MNTKKYILVLSLCLIGGMAQSVWALDILDDQTMSEMTGQDGLTIGIEGVSGGRYTFSQVSLEDTDGIFPASSTMPPASSPAALTYTTKTANTGIAFFSDTASTPVTGSPVSFVIDADKNGGAPTMNVAVMLASGLKRIQLDPFDLTLNQLDASKNPITTNQRKLLSATNGMKVDFKTTEQVVMNIQLGNQPQGALFNFTSGRIEQIDLSGLEIYSYSQNASGTMVISTDGKITLDLNLADGTGTTPTNGTGFSLAGIKIDPTTQGLLLNRAGTMDKFDLTVNNLMMGKAANQDSATFNNLKNASIGNIGLKGIAVSDFTAIVKGM